MPEASLALSDRGCAAPPIYPSRVCLAVARQPVRVQRPRRKGSPVPEGSKWVGRGTWWANPFAGRQWGHAKSVILHERWLTGRLGALSLQHLGFSDGEIGALDRRRIWIMTHLHELAGHDLACSCAVACRWCHANIYLRLAPIHAEFERFAA